MIRNHGRSKGLSSLLRFHERSILTAHLTKATTCNIVIRDEASQFSWKGKKDVSKPMRQFSVHSSASAEITPRMNESAVKSYFENIIEKQDDNATFDPTLAIRSDKNASYILALFYKEIYLCSSRQKKSIDLLIAIWSSVFALKDTNEHTSGLRKQLFNAKHLFISLLMEHNDYSTYAKIVLPLYELSEYRGQEESWYDSTFRLFKFQKTSKGIYFDKDAFSGFLKDNSVSNVVKRQLLAFYLRKGIKDSDQGSELYEVFATFVELIQFTKDRHFYFIQGSRRIYKKALQALAVSAHLHTFSEHMEKLKEIILMKSKMNQSIFNNFLTSMMSATYFSNPKMALKYWSLKRESDKPEKSYLSAEDLNLAVSAYIRLERFDDAFGLYREYPLLHSEVQIETLLKLSRNSKNWELMQREFEAMYGKGKLPSLVHYTIVMISLAKLGKKVQVDELFEQLKQRNIKATSSIFAALALSRVQKNDFEGSSKIFRDYIDLVTKKELYPKACCYICSLQFDLLISSGSLKNVMSYLCKILKLQSKLDIRFLSDHTFGALINFVGSNYGLKELNYLRQLGKDLHMSNEYYQNLIREYTRLDQFETAEELIFEAHSTSDIPFSNCEILKLQLRNYRFWLQNINLKHQKNFISKKVNSLLSYLDSNIEATKKFQGLYRELILFKMTYGDFKEAQGILELAEKQGVLSESQFIPFLNYYVRLKSFYGYNNVLKLYRRMAHIGVEMSTKTYVHLMKALIHLNQMNGKGEHSAYKLLQYVFEINGISLKDKHSTSSVSLSNEAAADLCKILTYYVNTTASHEKNMELIVHFLNQVKEKLGKNIGNDFKISVYKYLSQIYIGQAKFDLAQKLIEVAMEEMHERMSEIKLASQQLQLRQNGRIPSSLQNEFRIILDLKFKCINLNTEQEDTFFDILSEVKNMDIILSERQYGLILEKLADSSKPEVLFCILDICENYLVDGNWSEAKLLRKIQYLYKLTVLHLSQSLEDDMILRNFGLLNRFYNIHDIDHLRRSVVSSNPTLALEHALIEFNRSYPKITKGKYTNVDFLVKNMAQFFSPEIPNDKRLKIPHYLLSRIWNFILRFTGGDKIKIFKLLDEYPETVEFLLYNGPAKARLTNFRHEIDSIEPPANRYYEQHDSRRRRTIHALQTLLSTHSFYI